MTELLLGIDVGTSNCKAAVVDAGGRELAHGQVATPWRRVPTGAQTDPEDLVAAAAQAANQALANAPSEGRVVGIGVTSMAETGALLDGAGNVLHPAVVWHDSRGGPEAERMARELPDFVDRTGLPPIPLCTLPKLVHLGTANAHRWLNVAELVVHRLGGRQVSELSLSSRTGLLDLDRKAPYSDALEWAGLPSDLLAEIVLAGSDAGRSDGRAIAGTEGAVLTVAGHDHLAAGAGAGVIAPGDLLDSFGTAEALVRVVEPLDTDLRRRSVEADMSVGWHVADNRQVLLAGQWSGLALREVLDALAVGDADRPELDAGALATAPGDAPALELDLRSLQRAPLTLPDAPPERIWRAAIDTVTRELAAILRRMDAVVGQHTKLVVTGGWARDPAVLAAKRHLGAYETPPVVEAGCRGAALLGGVAAGLYASADDLPEVPTVAKELA
jgi:sugar (pentulose or hexulose) kinase